MPPSHGGSRRHIVAISLVPAIAGLLFGFDTGIVSGVLEAIATEFRLAPDDNIIRSVIVSAVTFGALVAAMSSGRLSNILGRKRSILLSAILFALGIACAALAPSITVLIAGRLIMGLAVGLSATVVPMYLSEVSPSRIRGAIIFTYQLAITVGIMLAFVEGYLFSTSWSWRVMISVALPPALVLFAGMLRLPESPRWLMLKGRAGRAEEVLGTYLPADVVVREMEIMRESVRRPQGGLGNLFTRRLLPLLAITFGLFMLQQLSGINTIFYYAPKVFQNSGFHSGEEALGISIITSGVNVLSSLAGIWLVDRLGRRLLCLVGFSVTAMCMFVLGAAQNHLIGTPETIPYISLVAVVIFILFFAVSLGGVPYLMMSEIFPLNLRGAGMATASCANWGFNWLVSVSFLSLASGIGFGNTFWLYGAFMLLGLVFGVLLLPETKGRELEDIEANLYAGVAPRRLGDTVAKAIP